MTIEGVSANPTKGTVDYDNGYWRRVGDSMEIQWAYRHTTAGTSGTGVYKIKIPNGEVVDTSKILVPASYDSPVVGSAQFGASDKLGVAVLYDSTSISLHAGSATVGEAPWSSTNEALSNANVRASFRAVVPIEGWEATTKHVITPATSTMTDWMPYTPIFAGFGTVSVQSFHHRRIGDTLHIKGTFTSGVSSGTIGKVSLPTGLTYDTVKHDFTSNEIAAGYWFRGAGSIAHGGTILMSDSVTDGFGFSNQGIFGGTGISALTRSGANNTLAAGNEASIVMSVPIAGWGSDATFLAAVPVQKVGYVKDSKTSGTEGGTFTSGAWQTRDLNTISGDFSKFGTLSSNQLTLSPGSYEFDGSATAYEVQAHQAKLRNITDSLDTIIGTSEFTNAGVDVNTKSVIKDKFTITKTTTFEIQHRCALTTINNGFGNEASMGVSEVYTQAKIIKLI